MLSGFVVGLVALTTGWFALPEYDRGGLASWLHHLTGREELKVSGLIPRHFPAWQQRVWDRYRVWIDPAAGCTATAEELAYVKGYNDVSERRLKARLGHDPWVLFGELMEPSLRGE